MEHKMKLQNNPFEMIKSKTKTIEMRLFDEKRSKINIGDVIEFTNISNGEIMKVKVLNLYKFSTFADLYKNFDKVKLGYKENELAKPEDMEKYYAADEINKYGVVGIEINLLDSDM